MVKQEKFQSIAGMAKVPGKLGVKEVGQECEILTSDIQTALDVCSIVDVFNLKFENSLETDFMEIARKLSTVTYIDTQKQRLKGKFMASVESEVYVAEGKIIFLRNNAKKVSKEDFKGLVSFSSEVINFFASEIEEENKEAEEKRNNIEKEEVKIIPAEFHLKCSENKGCKDRMCGLVDLCRKEGKVEMEKTAGNYQLIFPEGRIKIVDDCYPKLAAIFDSPPSLGVVSILRGIDYSDYYSGFEIKTGFTKKIKLSLEKLYSLGFKLCPKSINERDLKVFVYEGGSFNANYSIVTGELSIYCTMQKPDKALKSVDKWTDIANEMEQFLTLVKEEVEKVEK